MDNSFSGLTAKLSKAVCKKCLLRMRRKSNFFRLDDLEFERRWEDGYASCGPAVDIKRYTIYASPPTKCPYMFEHGVALARGDLDE